MMHSHHNSLPGYAPEQIFHDGCPECERRGGDPQAALDYMDIPTFARAWSRAAAWQRSASQVPGGISATEAPLLRLLGAVQYKLLAAVSQGRASVDPMQDAQPAGSRMWAEPFGVPDPDCWKCGGTGRVLGDPTVRCDACPGDLSPAEDERRVIARLDEIGEGE